MADFRLDSSEIRKIKIFEKLPQGCLEKKMNLKNSKMKNGFFEFICYSKQLQ